VGSFRENFPEFWYIMEATQQFLVEGGKLVIVSEGDLVATPTGSWHRAREDGPLTGLALIAGPGNLHYMQPGARSGGD
jgi:mannose-6-phosphate isomerase-like protein (cupin superfamily)